MNAPLKIKVCGMRQPENLERVCSLEPDFVGYIFYRGSGRYVGDKPDPAIFRIPSGRTRKVGVFVNEEPEEVKKTAAACALDLVQLHGGEPPEYCLSLSDAGIRVIKVLGPDSILDTGVTDRYRGIADYFLFDTPGEGTGGTGEQFDWDLLKEASVPAPYFLSGGIGPGDAGRIRGLDLRGLFGIDVNSRFETSPGMKEIGLLEGFIREIRKQ